MFPVFIVLPAVLQLLLSRNFGKKNGAFLIEIQLADLKSMKLLK